VFLDDNPDDVECSLQALIRADLRVDAQRCCDAESFQSALTTFDPDLVICDTALTAMDYRSAIQMVRAHRPGLPVLMVAREGAPHLVTEALRAGGRGYVLKGDVERLISEVMHLLANPHDFSSDDGEAPEMPRDASHLRLFAERAPICVRMTDREAKTVLYVSPAFEDIWGLSASSLMADPESWMQAIHPEDRADVAQALVRHSKKSPYNMTFRVIHPDDSLRWVHDRAFDLPPEPGHPPILGWFTEDITRTRTLERKLLQAQKMDAVGRLAGGIAHEYNNLLQTIFGFVELTDRALERPHEAEPYLGEIQDAARRAESLTRQLLLFSHRRTNQSALIQLQDVLVNVDSMLRRELGPDIDVELDLQEGIRPIQADVGQLEQVILNLASNARHAMPYGGVFTMATRQVHIDTELRSRDGQPLPRGHYSEILVSDDGGGMDETTLAQAFEPFFSTRRSAGGTGVGLATVDEIVRQNGGHVWMTARLNKGTTVRMLFPSRRPTVAPKRSAPPVPLNEINNRVVLLVEHESSILDLVGSLLSGEGCQVIRASGGDEALRAAVTHRGSIDLLLTDVVMPGLHGPDIHQRLRQVNPTLPAVFMSGYSSDLAAQEWGVDPTSIFLQKPFPPEKLLDAVRRALATVP